VSQILSVEALNQGFASALIDTDPQKSATEWGDLRTAAGIEAPTVVTPSGQGLRSILNELEERGAAIVFIDTPRTQPRRSMQPLK
jgi:cellulose biosynthesis protein BcsQ